MASFLPRDHSDEKPISLYEQSPPRVRRGGEVIDDVCRDTSKDNEKSPEAVQAGGGGGGGDELTAYGRESRKMLRKTIKLRNHLFDVLMSHFTTETNEFDVKYVVFLYMYIYILYALVIHFWHFIHVVGFELGFTLFIGVDFASFIELVYLFYLC